MSRRSGSRAAAAVPAAPETVPMPVQGAPAAARLAGVLRVGEALALARARPAAVGGCMVVDNTIHCFTTLEVMQWWVLLEEVLPGAREESGASGALKDWLNGTEVNNEAAAVAADFYRDYLQGEHLGLGPKNAADFEDFEKGMKIFRTALAKLGEKAEEAKVAKASSPSPRQASPATGGGG